MDDNTITDGEMAADQSKTKPKTRSAATRKDTTKSKASPRKQTAKSADSGLATMLRPWQRRLRGRFAVRQSLWPVRCGATRDERCRQSAQ